MATLVITTRRGQTYEATVRDTREANQEIARFRHIYLANHPLDEISNISVVSRGNIVARYRNGGVEDFCE